MWSSIPLVPKLLLGHAPCLRSSSFDARDCQGRAPSPLAAATKRSFADKCVTKLELGNEGRRTTCRNSSNSSSCMNRCGRRSCRRQITWHSSRSLFVIRGRMRPLRRRSVRWRCAAISAAKHGRRWDFVHKTACSGTKRPRRHPRRGKQSFPPRCVTKRSLVTRGLMKLILSLASVALFLTSAHAAAPAESSPVPLDAAMEASESLSISPETFAASFPQLRIPRVGMLVRPRVTGFSVKTGFGEVPHNQGRPATLFGLPVDQAGFVFQNGKLSFIDVQFLVRGRAVTMPQPEFEKLVAKCIEAISAKTGAAPVKDLKPEQSGAMANQWCSWPATSYFLIYSYSPADPSRNTPFRAEYISLRFPQKQ